MITKWDWEMRPDRLYYTIPHSTILFTKVKTVLQLRELAKTSGSLKVIWLGKEEEKSYWACWEDELLKELGKLVYLPHLTNLAFSKDPQYLHASWPSVYHLFLCTCWACGSVRKVGWRETQACWLPWVYMSWADAWKRTCVGLDPWITEGVHFWLAAFTHTK